MKYGIRQNWSNTLELLVKKPVILLPFMVFMFIEYLTLELVYFSGRKPLSLIAGPIIRKFWGEAFVHYPGNLLLLPRLFYFAQIAVYVAAGVALFAVSINIFKNIKNNLPLKKGALIKNVVRKYPSFFMLGSLMVASVFFLEKADVFILGRLPAFPFIVSLAFAFLTNIIMQAFLVLALPIIVIQKKPLLKSLAGSIYMGLRNFPTLFTLIFVPYLIYFPVVLLKTPGISAKLAGLTFPEINLYIVAIEIAIVMFVDCFVIMCASQFLLDAERGEGKK